MSVSVPLQGGSLKPARDLAGRTMVVTGATSGIGFAALQALAERGAFVIGVGRSEARIAEAQTAVLSQNPSVQVSFCLADLSSQRQVRALAAELRTRISEAAGGVLDVLVNNAATVANWYTATEDGYELQFAVNHLAPFLLTHELLPLLKAAPAGRVVTVSSASHRHARIHWEDVMLRRNYNTLQAYQQSKLANVLFSYELNRRLGPGSRLRAYAADPGLVNTEIGLKGTSGIVRWVWQWRRAGGASPERGAATVVHLAADPAVQGSPQVYWKNCRPLAPSGYAQREEEAARLWELSERLCGIEASSAW
ncbi:MAG: SDR family NAD(P)-dependent oxidoreductase [Anaerolineae bacterium]|nr:SDR family NAD(P)-dependent oxidoreductase [Anaerolineae bacterium]